MKNDEFAFFNQQLAGMLQDGIPLEGALARLCADMRQGPLKSELQALEADLAKGVPLREAVRSRKLPELYCYMLEVGAASNDLPAVLTLLADYYQRQHTVWTRLKGLMVYPMIVLVAAFALSFFLGVLLYHFVWPNLSAITNTHHVIGVWVGIWKAPVVLGIMVMAVVLALTLPGLRRALRWRLPVFKESGLAQIASAMSLMLKCGVPLDYALSLVERLEQGTPAGAELTAWRQRLAAGHGKLSEMAVAGRVFPPLFVWLISHTGDDPATGFQRAAEIYQARAAYRSELLLYSALPCSVMALGLIILSQIQPIVSAFVAFMNAIGDTGGS